MSRNELAYSKLVVQMELAQELLRVSPAQGEERRATGALVRSLRMTLACLARGEDPREVGARGFTCETGTTGDLAVLHRGRKLPGSGASLAAFLQQSGVELAPGQVILLEPAIVERVAEEALKELAARELEVRRDKTDLVAAYLAADGLAAAISSG